MGAFPEDDAKRAYWEKLAAATPPGAYAAYNVASVELEERIQAMRALPEQPKTLIEGLLFLSAPIAKT